ncbi:glycogen synthase GlgA [uncultured Clostridium sp.]|uniref:glycogen synthase GlgA n=1 Tax=uncultured Clostridium sp. TaxID=59620 RepID=UPI0025DF2C37|nr:glycogen synthase GlgA [uncultured Clostridium sp.]
MKVLFVTSECHPFLKTGGLGDVSYSLPKALRKFDDVDIRVIMPKYSSIPDYFKNSMSHKGNYIVSVGWRKQYCGIEFLEFDGIPFYFIDNEYYFNRPGSYGYTDEGERFTFFSKAVLQSIPYMHDFEPDIIHCNDWHTAMIPALLKDHYRFFDNYTRIKTALTIHNLQYQGVFDKSILDLLELNEGYFNESSLKYYNSVNFLKGGIVYSDKISTVSNTYANEIQSEPLGSTLGGLLHKRCNDLWGIVNGIDYDTFNPATDIHLPVKYDVNNYWLKRENKVNLQRELGLEQNADTPLIGLVSRLTDQKGLDLVCTVFEELMCSENVQFVLLGTGDPNYEHSFRYFANKYSNRCSSNIYFDNSLAQRIYGASDFFLMPSKFEPCGLSQLIALRYGSIPIVRETGGLRDTVFSYNEHYKEGNGFTFANYNARDMLNTIKRGLHFYWDKYHWDIISRNAMNSSNSWENSAYIYKDLYNTLIWG